MFDTARESSLSQAISNINAYLLNANTDNSLAANYRCAYLNLLSQKILLVPLPQPIMKNPRPAGIIGHRHGYPGKKAKFLL